MSSPDNMKSLDCTLYHVPPFLLKTYDLVSASENQKIVHWNDEGNELMIEDQVAFMNQVLPKYFKHKNLQSFIRRLNVYGFHKTSRKQQQAIIFSH